MIYVKKLNFKETDRTPVITVEQEEDLKKLVEKFPNKASVIKHVKYPMGKGGPFGDYLGSLHDVNKDTLVEIIATGRYAVNTTFEAALELLRQKAEGELKEAHIQKLHPEDCKFIRGKAEGLRLAKEALQEYLAQNVVLEHYFDITHDTEEGKCILAPKHGTDIIVGNNNTVTINLKYFGIDQDAE
ncbi:hypothetical protein BSP10_107 [Bacillus phage BSP10]|uniref:hypothetical protein n=1 Tax=Bacillus phage SPG24 TaxID=1497851 RepID=UPI000CA32F9A|nr:hypothetical protein IM043_gp118 [Bacillus phage SPG24]AUO79510.1 hypothetical protein BSP10_107 [Bacillus phage BSP10]AYJ74216.1 hypothetical protein BSP15_199 [Bacillus phage BSP15]QRI44658.1 hypothetical protein BSTP3_112 [Bacillus phage BSTP3]